MRIVFFFIGCMLLLSSLQAQKVNDRFELHIARANSPIRIDGVDEERAWADAQMTSDFFMILPMDTSMAKVKTTVRMAYDDHHIYLVAVCYNGVPGPYMVESLRRDFNFGKNDNFIIAVDPFDDRTNGFSFGANAAGAQWDGFIYEGGKMDLSWENKWVSAVMNYPDRWVFEAAIPFKSIRYKKGITKWGINFSRNDLKTTEKSAWAPVPRQFPSVSLAYTGNLVWDQPPPRSGANISLIPYVLGGLSKDYAKQTPTDTRKDIGMDAKVGITSSLNLDLTVNPDFSQVEVDKQVTNLERFELFFPERRQFFLENSDLFGSFGYSTIRPFFSRRIGLNAPIQYGARLSGRLDKNWRLGVMNMQTKGVEETDLPSQNFTVMALQRKVFARSNIGFIFVNKDSRNYTPDSDPATPEYSQYNRNLGLEYNLFSTNNFWSGKFLVLKSFSPDKDNKDWTHAANLNYTSKRWFLSWQHEYVGSNFNAEVGYVPRKGFFRLFPQASYLFFPRKTKVLAHGPIFSTSQYFDEQFKSTDHETNLSYKATFRNQSNLTGTISRTFIQLLAPFDPTNSGKDSLPTGSEHRWNTVAIDYISKPQSLFTYAFGARYGGYYADGKRTTLFGELGYRFQPYVSITMSTTYNDIKLPAPWNRTSFWLVGPRVDVTMTNKLFFTAFFQYNEQTKNMNLNTRFQWRYKPASDFFLVYTDNYLPENLSVKNRAVVLKFTYWFSI
ncbi:carbohydrate binding family 9 domain-containing protein [Flavihumibacter rivuli]|uniref:DUF5916 domain-containing protein n=1 Tax=Flavihumibacter rivuli TaxID=2838156 RepID=UPI001BDEDB6F|nr:DUF5916 domain-containing protein [Flavihumibacter rivuli]ULQ54883.1 carbohydrate binding family 9 domain-containing protein [Flavihumibacter rivuli]